jgi:predicted dinucleotide-binding enzyme
MPLREAGDRRLGIIGAGKLGTTIARAALEAGYEVAIAGSGSTERIATIIDVLAHGAQVMTSVEVATHADVIVLAIPAHRFHELPRTLFDGKILIDAMNYWEPIDGVSEELATAPLGTSVLVQQWFSDARVVKSLNQLGYHDLDESRRPSGDPERIAVAVAGDDPAAVRAAMRLVDELGFDALWVGSLSAGAMLGPDGIIFGAALRADDLAELLWPIAKRA